MKINNLSFPYPVLGIGDDVEPHPGIIGVDISKTARTFKFDVDLDMQNRDIITHINNGNAKYACEVECSGTLFRKCYFSEGPHLHIELDRTALAGRVTFQMSVVVIKPIKNYYNTNFHEDYIGYYFDLEPGDLLAFIGQFNYDADIKYDKLRSVGSFMQITEGKMEQMPKFDLGGDKINIKLPSDMYNQYKESILGNKQFSTIIHSSLVFNALVMALIYINENQETLWARTLQYRIDNSPELEPFRSTLDSQDAEDVLKLAQVLLMNPYKRMFESFRGMMDQDDDE